MQYRRTSNCEFAADSALAPVDILPDLTIQRFIQLVTASPLATGALTAVPCSIKNWSVLTMSPHWHLHGRVPSNRALL